MPNFFRSAKSKLLISGYSFLSGMTLNLVGQLSYGEILAILNLARVNKVKKLFRSVPDIKKVFTAFAFVLLSQIFSDIVNGTDTQDFMRGWANVIMSFVVVIFLSQLLLKSTDLIIFYFIGRIFKLFFFGMESDGLSLEEMAIFKFKIAPILNNIVFIAGWIVLRQRKNFHLYVVLLIGFYGLLCLSLDYRSNGVFMLLTATFFFFKKYLVGFSLKKFVYIVVASLSLFQVAYFFYVDEVLHGSFGGDHSKIQMQRLSNPYNPLELLMTGRAETFAAIKAIEDKPIFGHGSWAKDNTGKYILFLVKLHGNESNFSSIFENSRNKLIPSHSVIFGIWMMSGIVGFGAILYLMVLVLYRGVLLLRSAYMSGDPLYHVYILLILNCFWTFLFSPVPHLKGTLPITISFILVSYRNLELIREEEEQVHEVEMEDEYS